MDKVKSLWQKATEPNNEQEYEPVATHNVGETEPLRSSYEQEEDGYARSTKSAAADVEDFSWRTYSVFLLLGVAMLWAWNMFLAAGPYFQKRFQSSPWILKNFQSAELSTSTVLNLACVLILAQLQRRASYPKRIVSALILNIISFTLLAISTKLFKDWSAQAYFAFLLVQVLIAALATGILQNGIFAYVAGFGREEYMQGIMTGQAVAGVVPCVVQIISVLSSPRASTLEARVSNQGEDEAPQPPPTESSTAAMAYFLTATGVSLITLAAFLVLTAYRNSRTYRTISQSRRPSSASADQPKRESVPLTVLGYKLRWLASAVAISFAITMTFPVFAQKVLSVNDKSRSSTTSSRFYEPELFIPVAIFFWNIGDLIGRLLTAVPFLRISHLPRLVLTLAALRVVFIPMYYLCNIEGRGAAVDSDFFYLVVVQFLFGTSNGFIGSTAMMGAPDYVDVEEREAAGGFMGLALVLGLTIGSLMSFVFA